MILTAQKIAKYVVAVLVTFYFVIAIRTREVILIRKPKQEQKLFEREIERVKDAQEDAVPVQESFEARRSRLEKQCELYSDPYRIESYALGLNVTARIYQYNFFAYQGTNHMVCAVHKAGSNTITTFVTKILELGP